MYRIIGADGKEYGPITADQVRQWIAEGRANAQTRVLLEGTTEWKPLAQFPEFASQATPPGTPTTPIAPPAMPMYPSGLTGGASQVNGPATGLIVVAVLGFLLQAVALAFNFVGKSILASRATPGDAWASMFSGSLGVASNVVGILVSGVILFGGIKMKKLENYGLVMTASVIAMIPCISPCCIVGLPIGIWAMVVLSKPEVKSAFH
jgi:hypothetical protein